MRICGRRQLGITEFCPNKVEVFQTNLIGSASPRQGRRRGRPRKVTGTCCRVEAMPAVGGIRRTRVFGLYKGTDGARVLRSGRLLAMESGNGKHKKPGDDCDVMLIKDSNGNTLTGKDLSSPEKTDENGWAYTCKRNHDYFVRRVKREIPSPVSENGRDDGKKSFSAVYFRKRKRSYSGTLKEEAIDCLKDMIHELRPSCRQKVSCEEPFFAVVSDSSSAANYIGKLLLSILNYTRGVDLELSSLAKFLSSNPLCGAFTSKGIRFSWNPLNKSGLCKFFRVSHELPILTVDFTCIPSCFTYLHLNLVFQLKNLRVPSVNSYEEDDEEMICEDESIILVNSEPTSQETESSRVKTVHPSVRSSKLFGRSAQFRISLNSRDVRKRRSSLRQRRGGNHSTSQQNGHGFSINKKTSANLKTPRSGRSLRRSASSKSTSDTVISDEQSVSGQDSPVSNSSSVKFLEGSAKDTSICMANLLIVESDRCYRVLNVFVAREVSTTGEWLLVAKKDGKTLYRNLPHQSMKPCSFNRVTHHVIWSTDETCKLEFPNRLDWLIFKNLYKSCSDHNVPVATPKVIPVPGVSEVPDYEDYVLGGLFTRPELYITFQFDEVARALAKKSATYDADSEDEEWLRSLNNSSLTDEKFEQMIDGFERAIYCRPDEFSDEKSAVNLFEEMAEMDVVEAVYTYWMKKRKQKKSSLLRVLQEHHPKKAPLIPKPTLRKKRSSFKRQPSIISRGKQPGFFQAISINHDALEEQNAMLKMEEAKQSEKKIIDYAIAKRKRAQELMENADLAVYKAVMALKIAEAAVCCCDEDYGVCQMN